MFRLLNTRLRRLYRRLGWSIRRRSKPKVVVKKFGKTDSKSQFGGTRHELTTNGSAAVHPNAGFGTEKPIRIATFNAALFSMAPAVPKSEKSASLDFDNEETVRTRQRLDNSNLNFRAKSVNDRPKSILKQSPLHPNSSMNGNSSKDSNLSRQQKFGKSKLRVSINLPDNEISLLRSRKLSFTEEEKEKEHGVSSNSSSNGAITRIFKGKTPLRHSYSYNNYGTASSKPSSVGNGLGYRSTTRTVLEVLRELDADILALQDVKAEEERDMKPLSDLAKGLGMNYVFAESWAPEYGNAVLSKWPIKSWKVQKIFDDTDFRNVLRAVVDVPETGEVNFQCTLLDHLDESWRMKQINAIIHYRDPDAAPHILAGGLNALDETDYSPERWTDIVKYYEEMGKPTPKAEVMRFLKSKQYTDAKDYAGECESVVMIAKGQSVQGTCKYGTRVDYILSSPQSPYKFVPGSYSVMSSKGTSDHHIVKVDVVKCSSINLQDDNLNRKNRQRKQKVVKITNTSHSRGIWTTHS